MRKAGGTAAMPGGSADVMRDELIAVVEALTGRTVEAFLSDNLDDPDIAVAVFVMHASGNGGTRLT